MNIMIKNQRYRFNPALDLGGLDCGGYIYPKTDKVNQSWNPPIAKLLSTGQIINNHDTVIGDRKDILVEVSVQRG